MTKPEALAIVLDIVKRAPLLKTEIPGLQMALDVLGKEPKKPERKVKPKTK